MALTSITSQMSDSIEFVVTKRQSIFDYFKRVQQGKTHWLNIVKISKQNLLKHYPEEKLQKRINRWFMLGLSVGKLLEMPTGAAVVRGLTQLLDEYEHHITHREVDKSKPASAFTAAAHTSKTEQKKFNDSEPIKGAIHKIGKQVVYEYLQTPSLCIRGSMDYCEVVFSLCDVLSLLYSKFLDPSCQKPVVHEAILKADKKIKALVIGKMSKDLTTVAAAVLKGELKNLMTNMFVDEKRSNPLSKTFFNLSEKDDDETIMIGDDDDEKE